MMQLQRIAKCLATLIVVSVVVLGFGGCAGNGDQDPRLDSSGVLGPDG